MIHRQYIDEGSAAFYRECSDGSTGEVGYIIIHNIVLYKYNTLCVVQYNNF